jgi:O-antigen/teichoic acid export membrane protein
MLVAAGQIILSALVAVQTALLSRALRFDRLALAGIISSLASGVCGVGAAIAGWGVWALAAHLLVAAGFSTAVLWWVSDWKPSFTIRWSAARSFLRFGAHISVSSLLEVVYSHGFLLIIGKVYGVRDLGLWNRAVGVATLPTSVISQVISRTVLPLFAEKVGDPDALRRGLRMALGLSMVLSLPVMVGLSLLADVVVMALFGPKWMEAAPFLSVIALSGALLPVQVLNLNLLLATGASGTYLRIEIWKKLVGVLILGVGCALGLLALAYAAFLASVVSAVINAWPARRLVNFGPVRQLNDLAGVFLCGGLMAIAVLAAKSQIALSPWLALAVLSVVGAVTYLCAGLLLRIAHFRESWSLIGPVLNRAVRRRSKETLP